MTAKMPTGLGPRGRRLWRSINATYELSAAESELLAEAARVADRLDQLRALAASSPPTVPGSKGQLILHPVIAEERAQRDLLGRLLSRLALPGLDEAETAGALLGKRGAQARWYPQHRKGT